MENNLCPSCGINIEVEREMFSQDKFFTGHNCLGSQVEPYYLMPNLVGTLQMMAWLSPNTYLCSSVYGDSPAPMPHQNIGRN